MGQQFEIQSEILRDKLNSLLPSQARNGIAVDLTGSTQIIPVIDLTETAEGGTAREDLQKAFSHSSITAFTITNATDTVIVNNPGYWRVFGYSNTVANNTNSLNLFDGASAKNIVEFKVVDNVNLYNSAAFDFIIFLPAGASLRGTSTSSSCNINGNTRQIADITGKLVNPT